MVLKLSQKGQKVHLFALEPDVYEGKVSNIAETVKSQSKGKGKGGQKDYKNQRKLTLMES